MKTLSRLLYFAVFFAASFAFLAQAGCSSKGEGTGGGNSKVSKTNFDKVKDNMTEKEVTEILGTPSESKDIAGGKEHSWKNGNNRIQIGFKDGKVDYKSSQFVN